MDSELQGRRKAFRNLAVSGVILVLLLGGYMLLLRTLDSWKQSGHALETATGELPVLGTIGSLNLTNQLGTPVDLGSFRGQPWFANIIFTRCPGPCASMTRIMRQLQEQVSETSDVRFVSVSTDPAFDTPDILRQYARKFKADTNSWSFLTGTKKEIFRVSTQELKLVLIEKEEADRESPEDIFLHSTLTVLIDSLGRLRGYYEMLEDGALEKAIQDLSRLESTAH